EVLDQHQVISHISPPRKQKPLAVRRHRQTKARGVGVNSSYNGSAIAACELVEADFIMSMQPRFAVGVAVVEIINAVIEDGKSSAHDARQHLLLAGSVQQLPEKGPVIPGFRIIDGLVIVGIEGYIASIVCNLYGSPAFGRHPPDLGSAAAIRSEINPFSV